MKLLKPSHREKKRYVLIKGKDVNKDNIDSAIFDYIGVLGYANASPQIIKSKDREIIIAINRESLENFRASLVMSGKDISIVKVSGSLKKLK